MEVISMSIKMIYGNDINHKVRDVTEAIEFAKQHNLEEFEIFIGMTLIKYALFDDKFRMVNNG